MFFRKIRAFTKGISDKIFNFPSPRQVLKISMYKEYGFTLWLKHLKRVYYLKIDAKKGNQLLASSTVNNALQFRQ